MKVRNRFTQDAMNSMQKTILEESSGKVFSNIGREGRWGNMKGGVVDPYQKLPDHCWEISNPKTGHLEGISPQTRVFPQPTEIDESMRQESDKGSMR